MISFGNMFNFRDQLSLQSVQFYTKDLQNLIYFVNNVPIKGSIREYNQTGFLKVKGAFEKAAETHGAKIIPTLGKLASRILEQNLGFTDIHTLFLQLCNKYYVPTQALPILKHPGLFRNISKNKTAQFLIAGCDIYIKLEQYNKAYELISRGKNLELIDAQSTLKLNMRILVLELNQGLSIQAEVKEKLKLSGLKFEHMSLSSSTQKMKLNLIKETDFFLSLYAYRQLTEDEKNILRTEGLLDVYEQSKWSSLRKYISADIKKNNWRIKADSIKQVPLSNIEVVAGLNKNGEVFRYDCKDSTIYFNHRQSDQERLNSLITLAMNMSEEVANCKIVRRQREFMGDRGMRGHHFGGLGGLGGLGGFGGRKDDLFRRLS